MPVIVNHLTHIYNKGFNNATTALDDVNLVIEDGQFIGLIGHTGSGKTTLVQHISALMKPDSGSVYLNGEDIFDSNFDIKILRSKVGIVFQYPEYQLFEETVFKDVCFGPKNLGLEQKEIELRAFEALKQVGIADENFYQSPFDLSGGQKRRVAIAGVLAMKPEVLILDEPTAGLDPKGREEILDLVAGIQKERHITVILVSHSMEDVANYADRIIVMDKGKPVLDGTPLEVFSHLEELEQMGLAVPEVTYILKELQARGIPVRTSATTIDEARDEILRALGY